MNLLIACFNEVLKLGGRWRRGAIVRMPIDLDEGNDDNYGIASN